ncbi:MAG: hypothetical protein MJ074_05540 [Oscillospiraceae bacterium]|nr:hypothetical protein [Oscillospiraceae bacterium]
MNNLWKRIVDNYQIAKQCLWCPKNASGWHRQEDKGRYHLWQAYYEAKTAEHIIDNLLYARILMMMSHEHFNVSDYDRFHKYIAPAREAYSKAVATGQTVTEQELKAVNLSFESLQYTLKKTENTREQSMAAYACVDGLNDIKDFCFHDSKPVYFEHQDNRALLKLDYDGICVTFEFTDLLEFEANGDPTCNWINDFYCYPLFHNPEYYFFDVGYYRITCKQIRVYKENN